MHFQIVLQQLGYSEHEAKLYLASLKMGESNIADLAKQMQWPRSTVNELLEHMHAKGLMHYYVKHNRRYWLAVNPDKLMINLEERRAALRTIMPNLQAMRSDNGGKPNVQLYTGVEDLKHIMDDIIDTKHHVSALLCYDDWLDSFGEDYANDFIERRRSHFLRMRMVTPRTDLALKLKQKDQESLRQMRFLPTDTDLRRTSNFIYDGKTAMMSLGQKRPTGILIDDPDVAHAMSIYFENLWNASSER
ncbi:MAG: hypothetical protein A3C85_02965 [Candidatus Doudnabacteria bacterium RIFCSPHIGHO2_02_FULL_48_21]|uniref:Transcription regulator TrmB N-terminal domain-containing protein n=1 Tax=Candidatus Doudnabacteria bacterium RIFCSPLOWO2_02_FULL_48_13 TaxID=1817845 RepID=A0A1F5QC61_9BACT|nr:MAG: hypothetical protein A3K05_00225 [Candidatus Doudnabacteria bacterium RIFCSPHIGHO2_01_48_18]OGE79457.1 MAG: hypothetical protein A2668_02080 [Candidatus Doudnabacteria bacterium RIFCSPHIGHO2_01_FULL_48_180]OGE91610.1 MAG: hypothetical protein A3F44_02795 [Candidatus Doudnabacteria bacterium RIFCSPHIGHO2_12_FULL_47_25]OGE93225.1 MAG: hypothetical protein A3C85_02965 [Candidatus Doudnabacteria bacterium RIFCSPHIGHO2_02_FULL_48_21]OGE97914.1 MAG: hypothetical protein A3A83_03115 [Candidatu